MSSAKFQLIYVPLLIPFIEIYSQENLCKGLFPCPADQNESWGYRGYKAPPFWGLKYPMCYGENQSPIDIRTDDVKKDENLSPLALENYDRPVTNATIENNGHTIEVVPEDDVARSISVNGETYNLQQFHFHWGCYYAKGSEHAIDGKYYAMELHFVHTDSAGNIAVVGVFLQETDKNNEELQKIVDKLKEVQFKDTETDLDANLNLNNLLPSNPTPYYRYNGSLTTPPCSEGVTWSVAPEPIPVGRSQMNEFRKLYSSSEEEATPSCKLSNNFRPVQPLNGRIVTSPS